MQATASPSSQHGATVTSGEPARSRAAGKSTR
jgi:hypothetical protein